MPYIELVPHLYTFIGHSQNKQTIFKTKHIEKAYKFHQVYLYTLLTY